MLILQVFYLDGLKGVQSRGAKEAGHVLKRKYDEAVLEELDLDPASFSIKVGKAFMRIVKVGF
jgi:hypothetical protein